MPNAALKTLNVFSQELWSRESICRRHSGDLYSWGFFQHLIEQCEEQLCHLESILYSRQHPVRESTPGASHGLLTQVQRVTSEVEERLKQLVSHARMIKKLDGELKYFRNESTKLNNEMCSLTEDLKTLEKENLANKAAIFAQIEVS